MHSGSRSWGTTALSGWDLGGVLQHVVDGYDSRTLPSRCWTGSSSGGGGSKIILVSSESGSITLRHETEGGGMFGHHASKAASNMVGKLLSLDLKDQGIAVGIVHPGFMRTEMTRSVGFDQFWDDGGAVTPDEAAESLIRWIEVEFDMSKTGQYWAPRGAADIGTAEAVLGAKKGDLPTPLQLPW